MGIANQRRVAGWNKDYLCQLTGLKPIWMQSPRLPVFGLDLPCSGTSFLTV